jgi:hypothetical protein
MRKSLLILLALLSLVVASCGGEQGDVTTTLDESEVDVPDAVLLSYELAAGDIFVYDVDLTQTITMTAEGDGGSVTGDEEIPEAADIEITASGTVTYDVAAGTEDGTYEVTITGEFDDLTATGTVDGEPISDGEVPDFTDMAGAEPFSVTVIVDDQGNIVPEANELEDPFGGLMGGLEGFGGGSLPGTQLGHFFGPAFADQEVTVGDTWSDTVESPGLGEEMIVTTISSEVTGTDTVDGSEVFVIETNSTTSPIEFDMAEFMIALFSGFMTDDANAEDQAEIDAITENLRFLIATDEALSDSTTYFDPAASLTKQFDFTSGSNITMDINFPDETTGEMAGFVMEMSVGQTLNQRLVTAPDA